MHDMAVGDALQRYAVLTIGDGMVSQIPSLLVSIAAGLVITRVGHAGGGKHVHLATLIGRQVLAYPRAMVVTGAALSSFLFVPGFPKWTFGLWAVGAVAIGLHMLTGKRLHRTPAWISHAETGETQAFGEEAVASALAVQLSPSLRGKIDRQAFDRSMAASKSAVEIEMGLVFPLLQITYSPHAPDSGYQVLVQDVVVSRGTLRPGWFMLDPAAPAVPNAQVAEPFGPFARVAWTQAAPQDTRALTSEEVLVQHVESVVRSHVARLLGIQDVQRLIHRVQRDAPDLAAEVSRLVPLPRITEVLQRLLQEQVPIRNLRFIFESLVAWAPNEQDTTALTELVRVDMGRYITSRYVTPDRRLDAILFDATLLDRLQASLERTPRGNMLTLSPATTHEIREQVRELVASTAATNAKAIVAVVPLDIRRYVKKMLVEPVAPGVAVLSYQELEEDVALQPIGWINNPAVA
jgi:type III secretion protein V